MGDIMKYEPVIVVSADENFFNECVKNKCKLKDGSRISYRAFHSYNKPKHVDYIAFYINGSNEINYYAKIKNWHSRKRSDLGSWQFQHGVETHGDYKGDDVLEIAEIDELIKLTKPVLRRKQFRGMKRTTLNSLKKCNYIDELEQD